MPAGALAALFLLVGPALVAAAGNQDTASTPTADDAEAAFVARVAAERRAQDRGTLTVVEELAGVGRRHAAAMAADNRVYHNPALAEQVKGWQLVGENVGAGSSVDDVHAALMASQRHRDVIFNPRFTEIGVGVVVSNGKLWVSQVFREPTAESHHASADSAPATSPPAPAPPPTAPPPADAERAAAPLRASVRGTTLARTPAPPGAPQLAVTDPAAAPAPTAPPQAAFVPEPAAPAERAIEATSVAASAPLPLRAELPVAGVLAAFLLWSVVAGLTGVVGRLHTGPTF